MGAHINLSLRLFTTHKTEFRRNTSNKEVFFINREKIRAVTVS